MLLMAMIAGGHVLIEDVPGMGKTVLARSLAKSVDAAFGRIQFTPDLLPSDVTGLNFFDRKTGEFQFSPGPVSYTHLTGKFPVVPGVSLYPVSPIKPIRVPAFTSSPIWKSFA